MKFCSDYMSIYQHLNNIEASARSEKNILSISVLQPRVFLNSTFLGKAAVRVDITDSGAIKKKKKEKHKTLTQSHRKQKGRGQLDTSLKSEPQPASVIFAKAHALCFQLSQQLSHQVTC